MVIPYHIPVTVSTTVRDPTLEMLLAELSGVPTDSCGQGNMVETYQLLLLSKLYPVRSIWLQCCMNIYTSKGKSI